jgi:hypothetical protein
MNKQYPEGIWQHIETGKVYRIVMLTNMQSTRADFPKTVVYTDDTSTWSRPLEDFLKRTRPADQQWKRVQR